ncbi:MAG: hypothetical protein KKE11_06770 [Gammaproteobacteria bacterium]|nr:hypothetical protein [Gammaproteobacteria bacterium]
MEELKQAPYKKGCFVKSNIEVRSSSICPGGVFATKDFFPNEVIEESPVIIFKPLSIESQEEILKKSFFWDDKSQAIALGYGSFYNRTHDFNATFSIDYDEKIVKFIAAKPIFAGAEILVNHDGKVSDDVDGEELVFQEQENRRGLIKVFGLFFALFVLSRIFPDPFSLDTMSHINAKHGLSYINSELYPTYFQDLNIA